MRNILCITMLLLVGFAIGYVSVTPEPPAPQDMVDNLERILKQIEHR